MLACHHLGTEKNNAYQTHWCQSYSKKVRRFRKPGELSPQALSSNQSICCIRVGFSLVEKKELFQFNLQINLSKRLKGNLVLRHPVLSCLRPHFMMWRMMGADLREF